MKTDHLLDQLFLTVKQAANKCALDLSTVGKKTQSKYIWKCYMQNMEIDFIRKIHQLIELFDILFHFFNKMKSHKSFCATDGIIRLMKKRLHCQYCLLTLVTDNIYLSLCSSCCLQQNIMGSQTWESGKICLSPLWRLWGKNAGSSFLHSPFFAFSVLIEADLYQAAAALTPVTVTCYPLLHHSGLLTAECQLDNPLWNDLVLVSVKPEYCWSSNTPKWVISSL